MELSMLHNDVISPLSRDAFFATLRQRLAATPEGLYVQVLQCRWLASYSCCGLPGEIRQRVQQEFEQTVMQRLPERSLVGRILDDQLVVVSHNYYSLQADWLPCHRHQQQQEWTVYRSSVLHLHHFVQLSAVLQEGVQQIARERLVQEAQFEWQREDNSLSLYEGLHLALQRQEFFLEFQPQLDSHSGAWVGAEALLRWRHPVLGVIPPSVFIREAEHAGLIQTLGHWALGETVKAWQQIQQRFQQPVRMAVNVSFPELADPLYARRVLDIIEQQKMPANYLEVELTETAMIQDASLALHNLRLLKNAGVHIVLDDFGTGFSSLSHLSDLPITGIKLDRAFVSPLADQSKDAGPQSHIVTSMLELAKRMKLETTAEGVEDKQCLNIVHTLGCDRIQGYIYAQPLPLERLLAQAELGFSAQDFNQRSLF